MKMTRKELVMSVLRGEIPDRVPMIEFLSSKKLIKHFTDVSPSDYLTTDIMAVTKGMGLDGAFIPFGGFAGVLGDEKTHLKNFILKDNQYIDEWGVVFEKNDASWPGDAPVYHPIRNREDFERSFTVPDASQEWRLSDIEIAKKLNEDYDGAIIGMTNGPFTIALMVMGFTNMSYAIYDDPELLSDIMVKINEFLLVAVEKMIGAGVDAVLIAEDLGHKGGQFVNTQYMEEYIFPNIKVVIDKIKNLGSYSILHSCGNVTKIFDNIIELGVDAINPIQASADMDLGFIKANYGNKVTLIGNLDSTNILPYASVDEVKREAKRVMKTGAPNGRFIFCSDSDLRDEIPVENMLAMFESALEVAKY